MTARPVALKAADIGRHYHIEPYATLVLDGGYEEAGDQGRFQVSSGDILIHPAFSAHHDRVSTKQSYILDVPLPMDGRGWPGLASIPDLDEVIRAAAKDLLEAQEMLVSGLTPVERDRPDPADRLANALTEDPSISIGEWAACSGHSREWLSRRFKRLYGVDSALFRAEARSRLAWRNIVETSESLATISIDCGFADQAHMTRAVGRLTARSPGAWRRT